MPFITDSMLRSLDFLQDLLVDYRSPNWFTTNEGDTADGEKLFRYLVLSYVKDAFSQDEIRLRELHFVSAIADPSMAISVLEYVVYMHDFPVGKCANDCARTQILAASYILWFRDFQARFTAHDQSGFFRNYKPFPLPVSLAHMLIRCYRDTVEKHNTFIRNYSIEPLLSNLNRAQSH